LKRDYEGQKAFTCGFGLLNDGKKLVRWLKHIVAARNGKKRAVPTGKQGISMRNLS
jgi:hypothetical protein